MQAFRDNRIRFLVTTNLIARGIDVLLVNFVINFELPVGPQGAVDVETYIHRIGRTGRISLKGLVFSFVEEKDVKPFEAMAEKHGFVADELEEEYINQIPRILEKNEAANVELRRKLHLDG